MKASVPIIAILAVLVLASGILFFVNQNRISEQNDALLQQEQAIEAEKARAEEMNAKLQQEAAEKARLEEEARQARMMAAAQAEKERLEHEQMIREMNEQLAREAEMRREAELAQQELQQKMQELQLAQEEARTALAELEAAGQTATGEADLKKTIDEQAVQLAALETENQALKERQEVLEQQELATARAILEAGGTIDQTIPFINLRNYQIRPVHYFGDEETEEHGSGG